MKTTRILCHGCFEVLHIGHLFYLEAAAKLADELYVSVTNDGYVNKGPGRPIFRVEYRVQLLNALSCVHSAFISNHETAVNAILGIKPDMFAKGPDYQNGDTTGKLDLERAAVESIGGKLVIIQNEITFSSTAIVTGERLKERAARG